MKTHLASSISGQSNSEDSHPVSNGWENLVPRLHPAILDAAPHPKFWQRVDRVMVSWLLNVANKTPWLNPLALMGMVIASNEPANLMQYPWAMDGFLGWAIPDHYPDLASLKPNEALETYFGNPLQTRGRVAHRAYSAVQFQVTHYLESLPPQKRTALIPFLLPPLKPSRRLSRMSVFVEERAKQGRKERGFAVVKTLPHLIAIGRRRYRWLAELDRRVQQVFQSDRKSVV